MGCQLSRLPADVIHEILQYFALKDQLLKLRGVCRVAPAYLLKDLRWASWRHHVDSLLFPTRSTVFALETSPIEQALNERLYKVMSQTKLLRQNAVKRRRYHFNRADYLDSQLLYPVRPLNAQYFREDTQLVNRLSLVKDEQDRVAKRRKFPTRVV